MSKDRVITIRLKADDHELKDFIDSIPKMRKSAVLREMLLFSLKYGNGKNEQEENNGLDSSQIKAINESVLNELQELKSMLIDNQSTNEEIKYIVSNITFSESNEQHSLKEESDESDDHNDEESEYLNTEDTVNSMLAMFNVDD